MDAIGVGQLLPRSEPFIAHRSSHEPKQTHRRREHRDQQKHHWPDITVMASAPDCVDDFSQISIAAAGLFVSQLRLNALQCLLQLPVVELCVRDRFVVQRVPRGAIRFILFRFPVRKRDFVTRIGEHSPII